MDEFISYKNTVVRTGEEEPGMHWFYYMDLCNHSISGMILQTLYHLNLV